MKWRGRRQSSNVNDRRNSGGHMAGRIGGAGLIISLLIFLITGNPGALIGEIITQPSQQQMEYTETEQHKALFEYAGVVLADTEDTWNHVFPMYGKHYIPPKMEIYHQTIRSGCGLANSGMGPFYCPADQKVYLDLSFYNELVQRYGAKEGDFIMSYVISHEVGHHVQTLLGVSEQFHALRGKVSKREYNELSVRFELQADYLAGVVAHYQEKMGYLDPGDIEEALSAAEAIGDDAIQKKAQGYITPDTFTHGTSQQRMKWFMKGYRAGDLSEWDTFSARDL